MTVMIPQPVKATWRAAGTRIIGWLTFIVGFLGLADAATINAITRLVGPRGAPYVGPLCLVCAGLVVRYRGLKNASEIAAEVMRATTAAQTPTPPQSPEIPK